MSLLKLENISKTFYLDHVEINAVKRVSLNVEHGELVAIVGPSGSGKSTLLNIIGCLSTPTTGNYFFDGINVSHMNNTNLAEIRNKKIGFVFQSFNLLPNTTALHNVELPLIYADIHFNKRRKLSKEVLAQVGLKDRINHFPNQLSGGEQQRVAIARALVSNPSLILADEPTGNLDSKTGDQIIDILKEMHLTGKTIIIITHNETVAQKTDRIIRLEDGHTT